MPLIDLCLSINVEELFELEAATAVPEATEAPEAVDILTGLEGKDKASLNCPVNSQVSSFTWGGVTGRKWGKLSRTHASSLLMPKFCRLSSPLLNW